MNGHIELLRRAIEMLAAPAAEQARYLHQLGSAPEADELALELDDSFPAARRELMPESVKAIEELNSLLTSMSKPDLKELWTVEALAKRDEWNQIRRRAQRALKLFRTKGENVAMQEYSIGERLKGFAEGIRAFEVLRDQERAAGNEDAAKKWEDAIKGALEGIKTYLEKEGVL